MDLKIELLNSRYPWDYVDLGSCRCWWKGTIFFRNETIGIDRLVDLVISGRLHHEEHEAELNNFLKECNGSFAFVLLFPDHALCVVDRLRSTPLFYSHTGDQFTVSDDAYHLLECSGGLINEDRANEFLFTGYVTGSATLFDGIRQLRAGEYLICDKSRGTSAVHLYFHYLHGNYQAGTEEQHLGHLDSIMESVIDRLIGSTAGKTIVIPLSGGLDSRLVAALLKRSGVEDVICFSYGRSGNNEADSSEKVANALGYPWHFVEYTDSRWYTCYHSDEIREDERYAANLNSLPHIQDFLAVKMLKEEGKIPDDAVFVPGHTGDMLSGGHIPGDIRYFPADNDRFIADTLQRHYFLQKRTDGDEQLMGSFRGRLAESLGSIHIDDTDSLASRIEWFNFNERQAKFIVNSVRVYEFFGYGWRLPLWDSELVDFFLTIPLEFRLNQSLYLKYGFDVLFRGELGPLAKIPCTSLPRPPEARSRKKDIARKIPFAPEIAHRLFYKRKLMAEYYTHPLNWYSIMSPGQFRKWYSGHEDINSFLAGDT